MESQQQFHENRATNTDPRERGQEQQPYGSYNNYEGSKVYPRQQRPRGRAPWFLIILLIVLLLSGVIGSQKIFSASNETLPTRTFTGEHKVIVSNASGSIHIHTANTNTITIQATENVRGIGSLNNNDIQMKYIPEGETLQVQVDYGESFFSAKEVSLDITMPRTTEVSLKGASTDIRVEDVTGSVNADTASGNIITSDIKGQTTLSTTSGNITANGIDGQATFTATSGNITANDVNGQAMLTVTSGNITVNSSRLTGQTQLKTVDGNIHYTGSLDPHGNYSMETVNGNVQATLPTNTSFQLTTSTTSGDIHNDFGAQTVGNDPHASLSIHTTSGNIAIQKG